MGKLIHLMQLCPPSNANFVCMKMNATWHRKHRLPKNPTLEQRMMWHLEHARNCGCRDMPPKLKSQFDAWRRKHA
jgi:hypothetical protein